MQWFTYRTFGIFSTKKWENWKPNINYNRISEIDQMYRNAFMLRCEAVIHKNVCVCVCVCVKLKEMVRSMTRGRAVCPLN